MRPRVIRSLVLVTSFAALLLMAALDQGATPTAAVAAQSATRSDFDRWKTELSNWGRWGKNDELGTMNLITPAKRRRAADLVSEGFSVSLADDADAEKAIDNQNPYEHSMLALGSDRIGVAFHGIAHTHLDSLAHVNYDGVFYYGYTPD